MQRVVKEVADLIGIGPAIVLCRHWGNRDLYIPVEAEEGHPLTLAVGLEAAKKLVRAYAREKLSLPAEASVLREQRNEQIMLAITPVEQGGEGLSHERAAVRFGLTRQQIGHIAKRHREREELRAVRQAFAAA